MKYNEIYIMKYIIYIMKEFKKKIINSETAQKLNANMFLFVSQIKFPVKEYQTNK